MFIYKMRGQIVYFLSPTETNVLKTLSLFVIMFNELNLWLEIPLKETCNQQTCLFFTYFSNFDKILT